MHDSRSRVPFLPSAWAYTALAAAAFLATAGRAADPVSTPPTRRNPPEVRVHGYRVVVEKLQQTENLAIDFGDGEKGKVTGRQVVQVGLAVYPPTPRSIANIEGLDPRIIAFTTDNKPLTFQSYPSEDTSPLLGTAWRTLLMVQEVDLSVSRLGRLQGELVIYPRARLVTLDFPLADRLPQSRTAEGFHACLRQSRFKQGTLSVTVETECAPALSVTRPNPEAPFGVTALTKAGAPVLPNGGGSSTVKRGNQSVRQYSITFSELKEPPAVVRVEMLVRSGAPKKLAFVLPELLLPDTSRLAVEGEGDENRIGPVQQGHSLYRETGGTLEIPVRRRATPGRGTLLVGLSRRASAQFGPWQWVETDLDENGLGRIINLRPGLYRVSRSWAPAAADPGPDAHPDFATEFRSIPAVSLRKPSVLQVEVVAGKPVSLPAFDAM
jgi:hypothetical protein